MLVVVIFNLFPGDKRVERFCLTRIIDFRQFGVDTRGLKPLYSLNKSTKFLESLESPD